MVRGGFLRRLADWGQVVMLAGGVALAMPTGASAAPPDEAKAADQSVCVHGVKSGGLNVRSGAGLDKPVIGKLRSNACGLHLAGRCEGDWCEMEGPGAKGWVDTRYVGIYAFAPKASPSEPKRRKRLVKRSKPSARLARRRAAEVRARRRPVRYAWPRYGLFQGAPVATMFDRGATRACVAGVAPWDTLRIRSGPGAFHRQVGAIPPRACQVRPIGPCEGVWCRVAWHGRSGWVNSSYLD